MGHSDTRIPMKLRSTRLQNAGSAVSMVGRAVPNRWDVLFCLCLTAVACVIFLLAKSRSIPMFGDAAAFDGKYYLDIARHGYHFSGAIQERQNISFLPLAPSAIAVVRWLLPGHNDFLKIFFLGAVSLFGILLGFFALLQDCAGKQAARLTALAWAFSPLALYHFVGYTEPLFALCTVWCLVALRRGWLWRASLIAGVATLGRPQALVLPLFVGVEILRTLGWRPWRLLELRPMLQLVLMAIPLMVLASWMALAFHDSMLYVNAGAAWRIYYASIGTFLPFFRAVGYFMHSVSAESPMLTDWKVMLASISLAITALALAFSPAAPAREAWVYVALLVFLVLVESFDLNNFSRHVLYLVPWAVIFGCAMGRLPGPEWRKWIAITPLLALFTLVDVIAVMRFYRWEWVS